jgi:hypothetical protein
MNASARPEVREEFVAKRTTTKRRDSDAIAAVLKGEETHDHQ